VIAFHGGLLAGYHKQQLEQLQQQQQPLLNRQQQHDQMRPVQALYCSIKILAALYNMRIADSCWVAASLCAIAGL
jgi:hypothetical protein